jgi:site-specific recombinase XerD
MTFTEPPPDREAQRRYLTVGEWTALLATAAARNETILDRRNEALLRVIYEAGLRASEPGQIRLAYLKDLHSTGRMYVTRGKGSRDGYVDLSRACRSAIYTWITEAYPSNRPRDGFLFPGGWSRGAKRGLSSRQVRRVFVDLATEAKISVELRHPHVLKASRVQHLLELSKDNPNISTTDLIGTLAQLIGHKSAMTTVTYYLSQTSEAKRLVAEVTEDLAKVK